MKRFNVEVRIVPREGILDPQGEAVHGALRSLGFEGLAEVRVGRSILLSIEADEAEQARGAAESMCRQLLANPVTEDFTLMASEPPPTETAP